MRLFVDLGFAPYLKVQLKQDVVFVNFREPSRTRALYDEMAGLGPNRVVTSPP